MSSNRAPAKLNLGLHVLRRRQDGFHDLDTVFLRIPWCDRLWITPASDLSMTCSDPTLPVDDGNLCMRAARLLARACAAGRGAQIHLEKHIPHGSGLGGGSSDAATTIRLLLRLWEVDPSSVDLHDLALELGSDVPFFLGPPVARGEGRGERLTPMALPPCLETATFVVGVPPVRVSTGKAFEMVLPVATDRPPPASIVAGGPPPTWRVGLVNDFQEPVRRAEPRIDTALRSLESHAADYAALSGSGSAVYGVFGREDRAEEARDALDALSCVTWMGRAGDPADIAVR